MAPTDQAPQPAERPDDSVARPATCVTGADQAFWRSLWQMLRSVRRRGLDRAHRWIAFDLGLEPASRLLLERDFPWCDFRDFDFSGLPEHVAVQEGTFAWKPVLIWEVAQSAPGPVLWFDSATVFKAGIGPMLDAVERHGIYTLRGQSAMQDHTDPRVLEKLSFPRRLHATRMRAGGVLGFDPARPAIRALLQRWRDLALDPDAIRPPGATQATHKMDQALLSCLILPAADRGEIVPGSDDIDISAARPVRFLSTRNKVSPDTPVWADPLVRARFATVKFFDQLAWRMKGVRTPLTVAERWWSDAYDVLVSADGGRTATRVPCPVGHYYADPMLWREAGRDWLLVEDFSYLAERGRIAAIPLDGTAAGRALPALDPGCHASFPMLFSHGGRTFMVPETHQAGGIDLYECEDFPRRWRKRRRLLDGVDAVDTTVFEHAGRWWLMTSLASPEWSGSGRYLALFHTDDPVEGDWQPHPVNEQALHIGAKNGTGRNAGPVVAAGGVLYRVMQDSPDYYGQGLAVLRITELSGTAYAEEAAAPHCPFEAIAGRPGVHHVSSLGNLVAWDVRTRR